MVKTTITISKETLIMLKDVESFLWLQMHRHFTHDKAIRWMAQQVVIEKVKVVTTTASSEAVSSSVEAPQSGLHSRPSSMANNH